ncbi:BA14K family protein [Peteryoungia ipomoeae]|uniref:Lectin-like protein BA14k n=2 Tax=Peteryoungia ipomoeae TaxID=1210932 RepID=A0A4S8P891_9HYPH|nr:BA14K family protein [Peteryoungia ipomoeae]
MAEAAMPAPARPQMSNNALVENVDLVCDFNGCFEVWDEPPPRYRRPPPPPPRYDPPPYYDDEPGYHPPPPRHYRRPPPPSVYDEPARPRGSNWRRHVDWCLDRYRSYNPRTNTFLASRGYYKKCRSPYY